MEYDSEMETCGDLYANNLHLSDHAAFLDLAFRFYLAGGDAPKPNDRSFVLALKAQEQMFMTVSGLRRMRRQVEQDHYRASRDMARDNEKFLKKHQKSDDRTSRSSQRLFDRLSES